jgi:hypothetical protein
MISMVVYGAMLSTTATGASRWSVHRAGLAINLVFWVTVFVAGASSRFRRDTARVSQRPSRPYARETEL